MIANWGMPVNGGGPHLQTGTWDMLRPTPKKTHEVERHRKQVRPAQKQALSDRRTAQS